MLISSTSQMENIKGYFRGLSSPSGMLRIMAFFTAPVSNSAGHTRFPTFSRITRSRPSASRPASPWLVISASRWHIPPVCSWITFAPVVEMVAASTSESMSASMTPICISSCKAAIVLLRVVVFPEPGEDMRLRRKRCFSFKSLRSKSACSSLFSKTLFLISNILNVCMRNISLNVIWQPQP